jgi:hypothetical protein
MTTLWFIDYIESNLCFLEHHINEGLKGNNDKKNNCLNIINQEINNIEKIINDVDKDVKNISEIQLIWDANKIKTTNRINIMKEIIKENW